MGQMQDAVEGAAQAVGAIRRRLEGASHGPVQEIDLHPPEQRSYGVVVHRATWLEDTERVQREAYSLEPSGVPYVKEQATAAIVELAELLQSLPWKAGRDGLPGREPTDAEMNHAKEELVDVIIFAGNLAVALGYDDATVWTAVNEKACRNVERRRTAR